MNSIYFYIVYLIIVFAVCIRVIYNTNLASKTAAYLFVVIIFPVFGMFFYFSFGDNYRKKKLYLKKLEFDSSSYDELKENVARKAEEILQAHKSAIGHFFPLANYRRETHFVSDNNAVELLINGEHKFPEVIKSLEAAKDHIHIEYYIFVDDKIGNAIGDILIRKAQEGVTVRFIYDDFGSHSIRKLFIEKLKQAGVEAVPFYKINFIQLANRINYRNHRKIIVVDGSVGFVGGINVSDKYINSDSSALFWRDTHLKITGKAVLNLQYIFLTDWNFCAEQNIAFSFRFFPLEDTIETVYGNQLTQIIASGPSSDYPNIMYTLIQAIGLAKEEILLTTPYFIPEKSYLDAIKIAALSGIKIKILVPSVSDSFIINATCNSYYQELLEAGVAIYKYNKGFVHAKTMVCDNYVSFVGTANLDNRSFDLNFEVNAIVYDTKIAQELKHNFYKDLETADKIKIEEWNKRPLYVTLYERILSLFSSLM
ncbi:cardiolipin synthase [Bizionia gelidisalsuginis]|uniref:Cardiolipin synthase n=1 Tax=Bizionia gelidisalsuginis TaxID=291188 RepID=A0ABY3M975_9FLAO|nr:cardiolipin synthase [Bizionia gelidisalsuginis]TYC10796.1 cardiolipin synthase [Bizionia gelidisalsuginis]